MTDTSNTPSRSVEDFLKAVYVLQQSMKRVSTNALADALRVKAPSVTDMARRMEDAGLVHYEKYHGVLLTDTGTAIALKVIRRHRLIELYLVKELGYELQDVHDEAESLEHAVSERFIEALAAKLGHPEIDPHGDPIPSAEGVIASRELVSLNELATNTPAVVARLQATSADMLQYMLERDFRLDEQLEVLERDPFEGPITVEIAGQRRMIGHNVATCILVEPSKENTNN
jgi:DtxR family transcriptional regulator, Mn-dependent transcriptional regulator